MIVAPKGATASVDVRGGGAGTRETDLLAPHNTVQQVHAITLSGGSAFGLDAATGSWRSWNPGNRFPRPRAEQPAKVVPIVPAAVIFDLLLGRWDSRPDAATGRMAVKNALDEHSVAVGNIGAGLGASAGALKGGFGQASAVFPDDGAGGHDSSCSSGCQPASRVQSGGRKAVGNRGGARWRICPVRSAPRYTGS